MSVAAAQVHEVNVGYASNVAVGFDGLPSGVLLTGTPTVVEQGTTDLTISTILVNNTTVTVFGVDYPAGTAVTFHVTGGTANTTYTMRVTVSTDASPADTFVGDCKLRVLP